MDSKTSTVNRDKKGLVKWGTAFIDYLFPVNKRPVFLVSFTLSGLLGIAIYKVSERYFVKTNMVYQRGVRYLQNNEIIRNVVGHPIKLKTMKNLLTIRNTMMFKDKVIIHIDFKGKKNKGTLSIYGHRNAESKEWEVKKVEVKLSEYHYKNLILFKNETLEEEKIFTETL